MDPFESVTPIGTRQPPPFAALSQQEQQQRSRRTHAQRAGRREEVPPSKKLGEQKRLARSVLTMAELREMCSEIAEVNHLSAVDKDTKGADRKHASVAVGVMVDKLAMLSARPERGAGTEEEIRPGVRELVRVIVEAQGTAV